MNPAEMRERSHYLPLSPKNLMKKGDKMTLLKDRVKRLIENYNIDNEEDQISLYDLLPEIEKKEPVTEPIVVGYL